MNKNGKPLSAPCVDVEQLKRDTYKECCREGESAILNNLDFGIVSRTIDHLHSSGYLSAPAPQAQKGGSGD